jgi:hypothetical protein
MFFFMVKFLITVFVVVGLSEAAKRINPNFAGILLGLPLGAGITAYFFTYEQGVPFMLGAVPWAIAGLSASLLFTLAYVLAGRWFPRGNRITAMTVSTLAAVIVFFGFSFLLRLLEIDMLKALLLTGAVIALNIFALSRLGIGRGDRSARPMTSGVLLFRAVTAGLTITVITGLANIVGPGWSGILSAFPVMLFPLLLVLHYEEGHRLYPGVAYGFAFSVTNLVLFYVLIAVLLPRVHLNIAFVILYAASTLYLWSLNKARSRKAKA